MHVDFLITFDPLVRFDRAFTPSTATPAFFLWYYGVIYRDVSVYLQRTFVRGMSVLSRCTGSCYTRWNEVGILSMDKKHYS